MIFLVLRLLLSQDEYYCLPFHCKLELAIFHLTLKAVG